MRNVVLISVTMIFFVATTNGKSITSENAEHSKEEKPVQLQSKKNTAALDCSGGSEPSSCPCSCPCPCRTQPDVTSSCIAMKAAQEARAAAAAQLIAAAQASHQVKAQLAEKAIQAAKAAEAALAGKLVHVNQLEHEVKEAQAVVMEEAASCQRTQANLQISLAAAAQAAQLLKTLLCALRISHSTLSYTQQAEQGVTEELAEKAALLEAAKCRLNALMKELCVARQDLAEISQAACKAQAAARCACSTVQRCKRRSKRYELKNEQLKNLLANIYQSGRQVRQLLERVSKE